MTRWHVMLVALVLVNLLLVAALVSGDLSFNRQAQAQVSGGGNNYAVVTANTLQGNEDALWILDLKTRKLFALKLPSQQNLEMEVIGWRDLAQEMRGVRP